MHRRGTLVLIALCSVFGCGPGANSSQVTVRDHADPVTDRADRLFEITLDSGASVASTELTVTIDVPGDRTYQLAHLVADSNANARWDAGEVLTVNEPVDLIGVRHRGMSMRVNVSREESSGRFIRIGSGTWIIDPAP